VFEGKPPELKKEELAKRSTKREDATADLEAAKEVRPAALHQLRGSCALG
jgi:5'-3' exonuclease